MQLAPAPNAQWNDDAHTSFDVNIVLPGRGVVRTTIGQSDASFADGALISYMNISAPAPQAGITTIQLQIYAASKVRDLINTARSYTADDVTISSDASQGTRTDLNGLAEWGKANPSGVRNWVDNEHRIIPVTGSQYVALAPQVNEYSINLYAVLAEAIKRIQSTPPIIINTDQIDKLDWQR